MSQVSTDGAQAHPTVRLMSLGDLLPPFNLIGNCVKCKPRNEGCQKLIKNIPKIKKTI